MALDQVEAQSRAPVGTTLPCTFCARRAELLGAALLIGAGLFFALHALNLQFGSDGVPGPAVFPFALGLLLAAAAAAIGWDVLRSAPHGRKVELGHRDVLITFAALLFASFAFERIGTYITLGLLIATLLIFVGRVSVFRAAFASTAATGVFWFFFKEMLGLQLPAGPFF